MLNINNNTANVKREILVRIAKLQLEGKLEEGVHFIPREMVPRNKPPLRCCIFHDREIIRMRTLARLGFSVENIDEERTLLVHLQKKPWNEKNQPGLCSQLFTKHAMPVLKLTTWLQMHVRDVTQDLAK